MKNAFSIVLVLCMILVMILSFTACGNQGVSKTEESIQEDAADAENNSSWESVPSSTFSTAPSVTPQSEKNIDVENVDFSEHLIRTNNGELDDIAIEEATKMYYSEIIEKMIQEVKDGKFSDISCKSQSDDNYLDGSVLYRYMFVLDYTNNNTGNRKNQVITVKIFKNASKNGKLSITTSKMW